MSFSVLMSIYSKERYCHLDECFNSLYNQVVRPAELILVEDGPLSFEILDLIERNRGRLKILSIKLEKNVGLASALNEGLKYCKYDLVARMDTDDIAKPNRFQKQIKFMEENPDIDASSGFIDEFNGNGEVVSTRKLPLLPKDVNFFAKRRSPLSHPAVIFKKNAVLAVGGYPDVYPEDYLLWVKMIINGSKLANISDVILLMRTDNAFITRRGYNFLKGELKVYRYMKRSGFISNIEYVQIVIIRSILRLSPNFLKVLLYRLAR